MKISVLVLELVFQLIVIANEKCYLTPPYALKRDWLIFKLSLAFSYVIIFRFIESLCQSSAKDCQEMVDCIFPTDEVSSSKWSPCVKQTLNTGVQNLTLTNLVTKASARVSRACSIRFLAKTILIYHTQN